MKKLITNMGIFLLLTCMSACSSLVDLGSEKAPERVYLLKPYLLDRTASNTKQKTISVSMSAAPGLDTNKILILEPDAHLNHYASARWPDYTAEVFSSLIRNTLESSGRYSKVTSASITKSDKLSLEIEELYTLNDSLNNAQSVRVLLQGNLDCNTVSSSVSLKADVEVRQNKLSDIVAAYQTAVNEVSKQLLEQVARCK